MTFPMLNSYANFVLKKNMIIVVSCSHCMVMSWDVVCTYQQKKSDHSQLLLSRMTMKNDCFRFEVNKQNNTLEPIIKWFVPIFKNYFIISLLYSMNSVQLFIKDVSLPDKVLFILLIIFFIPNQGCWVFDLLKV